MQDIHSKVMSFMIIRCMNSCLGNP
jgi:hypothetical protein